ncbi:glutamate carboxypeptidase 2 homolog, partial [Hyalella azteca]|uniref:Glutamate carboxypeptidase 2 homolog n=1 Tax=Hyalella azteca TaxID=294128 RepID=A0A8B7N5U9_HYAAZ
MKMLERSHVILLVGGAAVGLIIGVLVGHVATSGNDAAGAESLAFTADQFDLDERQGSGRGSRELLRLISTENIGQNVRELTKAPHVAGGGRDEELVRWLQRKFLDFGFDDVSVPAREYLLSHPDPLNPNLVRLYDGDNATTFTSSYKELPLHPGDEHPEFSHAFCAYTPRGDVWTAVGEAAVYVNYGSLEDFARLAELNVTVKGRIAIVRYGKLFRGNKITHAAQYGAIGVILFSDPSDVAREGQKPEDVYPYTHWLPDGPAAPQEWQGGLEGLVYRLGPTMRPEFATHRLRLTSNNNEVVVKSSNVIATLKGGVEP